MHRLNPCFERHHSSLGINKIYDVGLEAIADALPNSVSLKYLGYVRSPPCTSIDSAAALMQVFEGPAGVCACASLGFHYGNKSGKSLLSALQNCPSLQTLK